MTALHIGVEIGITFWGKQICHHHIHFPKASALKGRFAERPSLCLMPDVPRVIFSDSISNITEEKGVVHGNFPHISAAGFVLRLTLFIQAAQRVFCMKGFHTPSSTTSGRCYSCDLQVGNFLIGQPSAFPGHRITAFNIEKIIFWLFLICRNSLNSLLLWVAEHFAVLLQGFQLLSVKSIITCINPFDELELEGIQYLPIEGPKHSKSQSEPSSYPAF